MTSRTAGDSAGLKDCDLIVRNATVLTLDPNRTVHRSGAVAVSGARIAAVGPESEILANFRAKRTIDAKGGPVHPGLIDGHMHIGQHTSRGIDALLARNPGTTVNFAAWKAELRDEDEYASTMLGALDLLRNGYTAFIEGGTALTPGAIARAAQDIGIRGWLTDPYIWDSSAVMDAVPRLLNPALAARVPFDRDRSLRDMGSQLHWNQQSESLLHGYVFLYGAGTGSLELQKAAKELADKHNVCFGQHHGYVREMSDLEDRLGCPGLVDLAELGVLDENSVLVHLNVVREPEVDPLVASGTSVIWCPANYLFFAAREVRGIMPELQNRGVTIGLGIDSTKNCAVGDTGMLALHAAGQCGTVLTGNNILEMLTINTAKAMRADHEVGSIEVGKRADIVIRTTSAPDAQPGFDEIFQVAVLGRSPSVNTVIVNGSVVLEDGQLVRTSEDIIYSQVQASVTGVISRLGLH